MLQNARVTDYITSELLRENQQRLKSCGAWGLVVINLPGHLKTNENSKSNISENRA